MRRGDHEAAWSVSDTVRSMNDPATQDDPRLPYHLRWVWDGRPFDGRRVLVRCYHGLGDTLQFVRYLRPLRQRVRSLTVEVQPELLPLLTGMAGIDRLMAFDVDRPAPPCECNFEIMELASALRIRPEALPPPYLLQSRPVDRWGIGLCWRGGDWDPGRSLPADLFRQLTHVSCVSLCPCPTTLGVINPAGCPATIAQTAKLVASLQLVITVDTMVAHLSGALNVPCWLLLKREADWRWMTERSDSPWYPSMRLYRQVCDGDWAEVMERVATDLAGVDPI